MLPSQLPSSVDAISSFSPTTRSSQTMSGRSSSHDSDTTTGSSVWFPSSASEHSGSETASDVSMKRVAPRDLGVGAMAHENGTCIPCMYWAKGICSQGDACTYCHLEHEQKMPKKVGARKKMSPPFDSTNENAESAAHHSSDRNIPSESTVAACAPAQVPDHVIAAAGGADADANVTRRCSSASKAANLKAVEAYGDAGHSIDTEVTHTKWLWTSHRRKLLVMVISLLLLAISMSVKIALKFE
eukprot:gnl/TRDRNA2_/TRDRNA2_174055_c0_seq4.p1 gnl/TRDRNA2_/TRDRNA2_174055_c0~~gnl/TRDRNA2_/TRDRNA2_174055_c0_seq4.p1  ORF type:complete len:243 (-),score=30.93 gnl/TRDRNA2_/TRDRNA2_174055_c0_seq4:17-745(-)